MNSTTKTERPRAKVGEAAQAEPPRDCPRCPRLVAFRHQWRAKEPHWFNAPVHSFGPLDARLDQGEAVVRPRLITPAGESERDQRLVEQVARVVAGERPAGPVGAAQAGGEADDQEPCVDRAE